MSNFRCEYPAEHRGKNLLTIPSDHLRCRPSSFTIVLLAVLSMVVAFCFMMLVYFVLHRKKCSLATKMRMFQKARYVAVNAKEENSLNADMKKPLRDGREFYA